MSTERNDDSLTPELLLALAEAAANEAPAIALSPTRKEALWSRIVQEVTPSPPPGTRTVRGEEGEWITCMPGVSVKILHIDKEKNTQTALWRMQPGAILPAHPHTIDEECLVLEGSIRSNSFTVKQGDFHVGLAGQRHSDIVSDGGALLLIRSERMYLGAH